APRLIRLRILTTAFSRGYHSVDAPRLKNSHRYCKLTPFIHTFLAERVTIYGAEFRSLSAAARKPATVNHSSNRPLEQFSGTQSRPEASSAQSKSSRGDPNRARCRHAEASQIPALPGKIRICRELPVL